MSKWRRLAVGLVLSATVASAGCFFEGEEEGHEHHHRRHYDYHLVLPEKPGAAAVGQPAPYVANRHFYSQMTP